MPTDDPAVTIFENSSDEAEFEDAEEFDDDCRDEKVHDEAKTLDCIHANVVCIQ